MLRQGLKTMDELEEAEEQEWLEAQSNQNQSQPQQSINFDLSDFSKFAVPGEQIVQVPESWALLGGGNETLTAFLDSPGFEQVPMNCQPHSNPTILQNIPTSLQQSTDCQSFQHCIHLHHDPYADVCLQEYYQVLFQVM